MKKFLILCALTTSSLYAEMKVIESNNNIDLLLEELVNAKGHCYGEEYYIHNQNDFPIRFSIKLTDSYNALDNLIKFTIIVEPDQKGSIGTVMQDNLRKESYWSYELMVKPD